MNLSTSMIPGLCAMLAGAVLTFGAGKLTHREKSVPTIKLIGVLLAALGAVLIFLD